jgi:DNA-binding response OmpR family regulator
VRVLLVEDDDRMGAAVADVLGHHGLVVDRAPSAREALELLTEDTDVVVLDLGLPDVDGFEVCARIRREWTVPILIATARGDLPSRVHGLHLGADDYLVKPYDVRELMARIHAVTRRAQAARLPAVDPEQGSGPGAAGPLHIGRVTLDRDGRRVVVDGRDIALTRKEFDLLALLAREPGVVLRREQIISEVWEARWGGGERTLEVHVASVRSKTGVAEVIETVRGVGYRLGRG